jgi:dihydroflavonol-4-reductase
MSEGNNTGGLAVVTGASGHLGANLVRELLSRGRRVRVLVHRETKALAGLPIERAEGDVLEPDALLRAFEGADTVFNLAAVISISGDRDGRVERVNVTGAGNTAAAARKAGVKKFVHCSSIHAFDLYRAQGRVDENTPRSDRPDSFDYDRSKFRGECAVRREVEQGLDAAIVNPTGVMGPIDYGPSRMGRVLLDLYQRKLPSLVEGGFDFVDVRDVVASILAAETKGRTGENYILGGAYHSVPELASIAASVTGVRPPRPASVTGVRPPRLVAPRWLARVGVPFALAYGRLTNTEPLYTYESLDTLGDDRHIDSSKAKRELGHAPRPLEQTIRDSYQWFADNGVVAKNALAGAHA